VSRLKLGLILNAAQYWNTHLEHREGTLCPVYGGLAGMYIHDRWQCVQYLDLMCNFVL